MKKIMLILVLMALGTTGCWAMKKKKSDPVYRRFCQQVHKIVVVYQFDDSLLLGHPIIQKNNVSKFKQAYSWLVSNDYFSSKEARKEFPITNGTMCITLHYDPDNPSKKSKKK